MIACGVKPLNRHGRDKSVWIKSENFKAGKIGSREKANLAWFIEMGKPSDWRETDPSGLERSSRQGRL